MSVEAFSLVFLVGTVAQNFLNKYSVLKCSGVKSFSKNSNKFGFGTFIVYLNNDRVICILLDINTPSILYTDDFTLL